MRGCAAALVVLVASCHHYRTSIPGVLDLRSDGTGAPVADVPLAPGAERNGLDALMKGDGTTGRVEVQIHDRAVWALRLMYLGDGASSELQHALRGPSALRNLTIAEEIGAGDVALFCCTMPVSCFSLVLGPTFSFRATGTRIALDDIASFHDKPVPDPAVPLSAPSLLTAPVKEPTPAFAVERAAR